MNKTIIVFVSLIFILAGCVSPTKPVIWDPTPVNPTLPIGTYPVNSETAKLFKAWEDSQSELRKVEQVIDYNTNEYFKNHEKALAFFDSAQYDKADQQLATISAQHEKTVAVIATIKTQKDFPEIAQLKTVLAEMMRLEKLSTEYFAKTIQAKKVGDEPIQKETEDLYVQYYNEAMTQNYAMLNLYGKALLWGADITSKKTLEEFAPPITK
jgi:hypothetical protein